jgi:hypothetical protein
MGLLFRAALPEGQFLLGPQIQTPAHRRCTVITTRAKDLGPTMAFVTAAGLHAASGWPDEFLSPGRGNDGWMDFHQMASSFVDGRRTSTWPGLEDTLCATHVSGAHPVELLRKDTGKRAALDQRVSAETQRGEAFNEIFYQSRFFGLPALYTLVAVHRRGHAYVAIARQRYSPESAHTVLVGQPDAMVAESAQRSTRAGRFVFDTSVGKVSLTSSTLVYSDVIGMLFATAGIQSVTADTLERDTLRALGLAHTPADTISAPPLLTT